MDKTFATRQGVKNNNPQSVSVARKVMNAVRKLQGKQGISLHDLKKYLRDERNIDLGEHNMEINLALKNGVDRGILLRESGNYKIRENKRRRRSRSRGKSSGRRRRSRRRSGGKSRRRSSRRRSRRRKKVAEE